MAATLPEFVCVAPHLFNGLAVTSGSPWPGQDCWLKTSGQSAIVPALPLHVPACAGVPADLRPRLVGTCPEPLWSPIRSSGADNTMCEPVRARLLVPGPGPAGCTAAVHAARASLSPILVTGVEVVGRMATTTDVDH